MKPARVRHDRGSVLSRGPYAFCAIQRGTRHAGESVNPLASIIARSFRTVSSPASSLSCFHGARRNIRQCRGVLAKLSVALGRLRFTRSCLASPRLASSRLPGGLRVRSQRGYLYVSSTPLCSARLGFGAQPNSRERIGRKETARRAMLCTRGKERERE